MAEKDFKPGDKVELKDKGTMFVDPATGFNVTGKEKTALTKPIGKATNRALVSGALLIVGKGRMLGAGPETEAEPAKAKEKAK